ncbi:MAG: DUF2922 domain-containing protein [Bacteroides thetaiotaomicron]
MAELKAKLVFTRADGNNTTMTIADADPTLNAPRINAAMDTILSKNVFAPAASDLVSKVSGTLISTETTEFTMS